MDKKQLIQNLRKNIISALNLQGVQESDIAADTPLFDDNGLALDSVDALELIVMLEKEYGVTVDNNADTKLIFSTIQNLADYIAEIKK